MKLLSGFFRSWSKKDKSDATNTVVHLPVVELPADFDVSIAEPEKPEEELVEEPEEAHEDVDEEAHTATQDKVATENVPEPPITPRGYARPGHPGYEAQQAYLAAMAPSGPVEVTVPDMPSAGGQRYDHCDVVKAVDMKAFCDRVPFVIRDCADTTGLDPLTALLFRQCFMQLSEGKRAALYAYGGLRLVRAYVLQLADKMIAEQYPLIGWYRWCKSWFVTPHKDFEA